MIIYYKVLFYKQTKNKLRKYFEEKVVKDF